MNHSDTIAQLTEALSKAQGAFPAVPKSGENKHLGNVYSTLDDIIAAVRKPLAANGLTFIQPLTTDNNGQFVLETILLHSSGEWLSSTVAMPTLSGSRAVNELQAFGSALTYMRRYMLAALLGVTSEEDVDGNSTELPKPGAKKKPMPREVQSPTGNGDAPKHWIDDPKVRARFWAWTSNTLALSDDEVHEALNIVSVRNFTGTMAQAKVKIESWVKARDAVEADEALAAFEESSDG